jgi:hypothetical protein
MKPEFAAEFQQSVVSSADLAPGVADGTRKSFERLRTLHSYGILCYEAFTVADDLAWLLMEKALGERFMTYFEGCIPLVKSKDGSEATIYAQRLEEVHDALNRAGAYAKGGWKLRLRSTGELMEFRATLAHLQRWARREGLLHGQHNKRAEWVYSRIRNRVAHPSYRLGMPSDSARTIRDLAEVINRLWGVLTSGGRLYPAPLAREVLVIGWTEGDHGPTLTLLSADQLASFDKVGEWMYLVIRGVGHDHELWDFDAQFERTTFPSELLWGPGNKDDALAWLDVERPSGDEVHYLDRLFAVHIRGGKVYLPRRPEVALALPADHRDGEWRVVRADFPNDALAHVRHLNNGVACTMRPPEGCPVEEVSVGNWNATVRELAKGHAAVEPARLSNGRTPRRWQLAPDVGDD